MSATVNGRHGAGGRQQPREALVEEAAVEEPGQLVAHRVEPERPRPHDHGGVDDRRHGDELQPADLRVPLERAVDRFARPRRRLVQPHPRDDARRTAAARRRRPPGTRAGRSAGRCRPAPRSTSCSAPGCWWRRWAGRPAMKLTKPSEMIATSNWLVAKPSHGGGTGRAASRSNQTAKPAPRRSTPGRASSRSATGWRATS